MTAYRVTALSGDTTSSARALVVRSLSATTASTASAGAIRVSRLQATSVAATPPSAGAALSDIEPYSSVSLTGLGDSLGLWSQIGGVSVNIAGSGSTRSYVAPALVSGGVLRFRYTVAGQSDTVEHVVLPATELMSSGGSLVPVRWLLTSEMK